jgi:hypothetical protein
MKKIVILKKGKGLHITNKGIFSTEDLLEILNKEKNNHVKLKTK